MLVEICERGDRADDVGRLVHDDDGGGPKPGFQIAQRVEIHGTIDDLVSGNAGYRSPARYDRQEIVPACRACRPHASRSARETECPSLPRHCTACSHGPRCRRAWCRCCSDGRSCEPSGPAPHDRADDGDQFHVVDGGWGTIEADIGRKGRLHARLALLALEAFEKSGLLTADIGAGAMVDDKDRNPSREYCSCRSAALRRPHRSPPASARVRE